MKTILRALAALTVVLAFAPAAANAAIAPKPTPCNTSGLFLEDEAGDQVAAPLHGVSSTLNQQAHPAGDNADLTGLFFNYRSQLDGSRVLTANIKVKNFSLALPDTKDSQGGLHYYVVWTGADGFVHFVRASNTDGTASGFNYHYGTLDRSTGVITTDGATTGATFSGADGIVQIVVPEQIAAGAPDSISDVVAVTDGITGYDDAAGINNHFDAMPDGGDPFKAGTGQDYQVTPCDGDPAGDGTNAYSWSESYVATSDPTITLHADVMRPRGAPADAKLPVILSIGPYFNHSNQAATDIDPTRKGPSTRFDDLIGQGRIFTPDKGYVLIYVDLPGFGASTGCNDFGGPNEQLGVKSAIEWAAAQPWSNGKVGMWGKSYDGWTQVMALAQKPKGLAATVIQSPIIDGYRTLYQNGIHYDQGWYVTPALYQAIDATPPAINDSPDYFAHWALGENPACYAANITQQTAFVDKDDPAGFWAKRDIAAAASENTAAVLWSHGFLDANTKPDNFLDVWKNLKGPHRAWFGQYDHQRANDTPQSGRKGFMDEAMRWFDHHLKGNEAAGDANDPLVEVSDNDGNWRAEAQWPPADAAARTMPLKPGTYTDDANNNATSSPNGVGAWTFTQPVTSNVRIAGVPKLTVDVSTQAPRAALVGLLYDVDYAAGKAKLISRGAYAIKQSGKVTFELYPQDWLLKSGHRLGFLVAGDDGDWYLTAHSKQPVTVSGGSVSIPFLATPRTAFIVKNAKTPAMAAQLAITITKATIDANTVPADLP